MISILSDKEYAMEMIERKNCAITGADDLEPLYTFKHFPVFMGVTDQATESDEYTDMEWGISKSSGCIQLLKLVSQDVVYQTSHGSGSTGNTWIRHHQSFADFIYQFKPSSIIEIGGGHGILAKNYKDKIDWTIIEPNPTPVKNTPAKYIKAFFDESFAKTYNNSFDGVVNSHVFEHMYDSAGFMKLLGAFVPENNFLFFSVPNLYKWLKNKFTNSIMFEHSIFLAESYIDYLLTKYGFRLLKKDKFEDHSLFYAAFRDSSVKKIELSETLHKENKALFMEYVEYYKKLIAQLNNKLDMLDQKAYIFGAHVFTQFLLALGLNSDKLECILDNDAHKQGKRLYGTSLKVLSPPHIK